MHNADRIQRVEEALQEKGLDSLVDNVLGIDTGEPGEVAVFIGEHDYHGSVDDVVSRIASLPDFTGKTVNADVLTDALSDLLTPPTQDPSASDPPP